MRRQTTTMMTMMMRSFHNSKFDDSALTMDIFGQNIKLMYTTTLQYDLENELINKKGRKNYF
jgi:hypothetical protein